MPKSRFAGFLKKISPHTKDAFPLILLFVLLAGVFVGVYLLSLSTELRKKAQVGEVDLSLVASTNSVTAGETFTVDVFMNTNSQVVSATELHIQYNPNYLEAQSFISSGVLSMVLPPCYQCPAVAAISEGHATLILGSEPSSPFQGSGAIASLTFKALQESPNPEEIGFAAETMVAAIGFSGDVARLLTPTQVTIISGSTTPTPEPTTVPNTAELLFRFNFQGITQASLHKSSKTVSVVLAQDGQEKYRFDGIQAAYTFNIFTIEATGIEYGTYDVYIKGPVHLRKMFEAVDIRKRITIVERTGVEDEIVLGDFNNDNKLDILDVAGADGILKYYTQLSAETDPTALPVSPLLRFDLDGSGDFDLLDVGLVLANYTALEIYGD